MPTSTSALPGSEVLRTENLANLGLALPARPVLLVKFHELHRRLDRFFLRFQLKLCVTADDLLGFGERPVGHGDLPLVKPDAGTRRGWSEPSAPEHRAGFGLLFAGLRYRVHQRLGRRARFLGGLGYHHELHGHFSFWFRGWELGFPDSFDRLNPASIYTSNEGL